MEVRLWLDPKLVWKLTDLAEVEGVSLQEFIKSRLEDNPNPVKVPEFGSVVETRERVALLHGQGFTDVEMAARLDRVVAHVARVRRGLGLGPNRKERRK